MTPDAAVVLMDQVQQDVARSFFRRTSILAGISLEIQPGESVALVGPSGAGKTSLLRVVLGLSRPTHGTVRIFGGAPGAAAARHRIGFLPDDQGLPSRSTGNQILSLHARLAAVDVAAPLECCRRLGIEQDLNRSVGVWSLGMRVRLALAIALIGPPELLVLDEPFTGLDLQTRDRVKEELARHADGGRVMIVSSHLLLDLAGLVTRVCLIQGGRITADETAAKVFENDPETWFREKIAS